MVGVWHVSSLCVHDVCMYVCGRGMYMWECVMFLVCGICDM